MSSSTAFAVPAEGGESKESTQRSRRRRQRLRLAGLKTVSYALDGQLVDGIEAAARRFGLDPASYLARLVLPDLMRLGIVRVGNAPAAEKEPA